jgi:hypothetical protein
VRRVLDVRKRWRNAAIGSSGKPIKKALEKGEYLQGSNALSCLYDTAPLREEKREVMNHLPVR